MKIGVSLRITIVKIQKCVVITISAPVRSHKVSLVLSPIECENTISYSIKTAYTTIRITALCFNANPGSDREGYARACIHAKRRQVLGVNFI